MNFKIVKLSILYNLSSLLVFHNYDPQFLIIFLDGYIKKKNWDKIYNWCRSINSLHIFQCKHDAGNLFDDIVHCLFVTGARLISMLFHQFSISNCRLYFSSKNFILVYSPDVAALCILLFCFKYSRAIYTCAVCNNSIVLKRWIIDPYE